MKSDRKSRLRLGKPKQLSQEEQVELLAQKAAQAWEDLDSPVQMLVDLLLATGVVPLRSPVKLVEDQPLLAQTLQYPASLVSQEDREAWLEGGQKLPEAAELVLQVGYQGRYGD